MFDRKIRFFTVRFLNRNGSKMMSAIGTSRLECLRIQRVQARLLWDEGAIQARPPCSKQKDFVAVAASTCGKLRRHP
jgi:hypothetical protein